jgi:hypothetical protein
MSRGAHSFKQGDLTKVIKSVDKSGLKDWRIEVVEGKFILFPAAPVSASDIKVDSDANEWDSVK